HDFASLARLEGLRAEIDGVVKRGGGAHAQAVNAGVNAFEAAGKGNNFIHAGLELVERERIYGAKDGVNKTARGFELERKIATRAQAGIYRQDDGERQLGFAAEDGDLLRDVVFEKLKT